MSTSEPAGAEAGIRRGSRIVVGVDGSDTSLSALRRGARIARELGCRLVGMTAWEQPVAWPGYYGGSIAPEADARAVLEDATRAVFGTEWPTWYTAVTREGWPAHVLISESDGAEMLIVGSRGLGGVAGLILGSASQYCVEHAHCPVLVVPAAGRTAHDRNAHAVVGAEGG
ncbi:MAG TPA: universal stress protein [Microbacterium sp.]|uniref:universal stress protein n=1 Tax=Microbacterium sp. TaxID=51671 RepID=UPI002B47273B|nr:universal stress protein [Microbacterium sp.]HKT56530.1 universal stress protein [Microbacterium sp.]